MRKFAVGVVGLTKATLFIGAALFVAFFFWPLLASAGIGLEPRKESKIHHYAAQCAAVYGGGIDMICGRPMVTAEQLENQIMPVFLEIRNLAQDNMSSTSWVSIKAFPEVPKIFVNFSDGIIVYAAGKGETLKEALEDLRVSFIKTKLTQ